VKQNTERAKYQQVKHELCPKTSEDYVTITSWTGWTENDKLESLKECPVKCRVIDRLSAETTMYIEHGVVSLPRKAPYPVLSGVVCLEPECNFPVPHVRDNTYGGIKDAQIVANFDRLTDVPISYADGFFTWMGCDQDPGASSNPFKCIPNAPTVEELKGKKLGTAFIANCGRPRRRLDDWENAFHKSGWNTGHARRKFFERLQSHLGRKGRNIDSYGSCLHTPGMYISAPSGGERYAVQARVIRNYKFHMVRCAALLLLFSLWKLISCSCSSFLQAFENSIVRDYNTEKQW